MNFKKEMEFNQTETRIEEMTIDELRCSENDLECMSVSLEAEVPEALYVGMKDFISTNEKWNQSNILAQLLQISFFKMVLKIGPL